jgi:GNAT superfamily N-acetyltransferase
MISVETVATAGDARIAAALARSFADDPVFTWLFPDDERPARIERFFSPLVALAQSGRGQVWSTPDRAGTAVWMAPGRWQLGLLDQARLLPRMLRAFGRRIVRCLRLMHAMEQQHLSEPHHYLFIIGTDPAQQGRGVGAALMAPMLERCDSDGLPAYLESSNPRNLSFYRRHGFEELSEVRVADSPPLTRMRRPPRRRR